MAVWLPVPVDTEREEEPKRRSGMKGEKFNLSHCLWRRDGKSLVVSGEPKQYLPIEKGTSATVLIVQGDDYYHT